MKLSNLSYKILNTGVFCLFISTFEILSNLPIIICSCFKMLLLGVLKIQNAYIYPLVDVSIHFTHLLGFLLNACSKIYIHFNLLFCFKMRICCCFTVRNYEVLLGYVGTPQRGSHRNKFT